MQYAFPQRRHGYQNFRGPRSQPHEYYYLPPPPCPTNYHPPHNHGFPLSHYPAGSPNYVNTAFPRHSVNAGGNWHVGNGIQKNGDVKLGYGNGSHAKLNNRETKRKKRKSTVIGGCHGNQGGHQASGDVILGDIH